MACSVYIKDIYIFPEIVKDPKNFISLKKILSEKARDEGKNELEEGLTVLEICNKILELFVED